MGLNTSHGCWHGPYSAFSRWRNEVARAAGYKIERVTDETKFTHEQAQIDWDRIERDNPGCYQGEWSKPESDAAIYIIAHSDCDGVIHPAQAALLADRLEELIPKMPVHVGFDHPQEQTTRFIAGLRKAVEAGEDVEFH